MNILLVATHFNTGGITTYILTLAKGFIQRGHKVIVVSSGGELVEALQKMGGAHFPMNISTKSELDPKIYLAALRLRNVVAYKKIDIIHSHTRVTQVLGQVLSFLTKIPYVATCHGFYKLRLSRRLWPCWGDAAIAISPPVQEHLTRDFGVPEKKTFLVHNGIDVSRFPVPDEKSRQEKRGLYGFSDHLVIGIIARLADVKGHSVLIRALPKVLKRFPNAQLLIVGEGKEEENLRRLVQQLNIGEHVTFMSIVNRTAEILPLFDVSVLPSLDEGLGISIMEAQIMGVPVIATNVGGIPSLIKDGETGLLVNPGDPDALADAIIRVLNDKELAKRLGTQAREFILREFNSDLMVEDTLAVYQKVIGDRK